MIVISIITVEREYGSGGAGIAQKLSERLGWKLWDRELTCAIARLAKVDTAVVERREERCDRLFYRLGKVFLRGSFERAMPLSGLEHLDADSMVDLIQRVTEEAAATGKCVIVGRGSPYFLRHHQDAFHVFIYAPQADKVRRVQAAGKSEAEAFELVETVDRERAAFIKRYFGKEWPNRYLYHMMINSKVGEDLVVEMILGEIAALDRRSAAK